MKRWTTLALSTTLMFTTFEMCATPAYAATVHMLPTVLEDNGTAIVSADHRVHVDPWSGAQTSWLPVYYLDEAMMGMTIRAHWNGTTSSWNMKTSLSADLSNLPTSQSTGATVMAIEINGQVVEYAPRLVAIDPASGQPTTYVPFYYVMQALKRLGVTSTWQNNTWNMVAPTTDSTGTPVTMQQAATAFEADYGVDPLTAFVPSYFSKAASWFHFFMSSDYNTTQTPTIDTWDEWVMSKYLVPSNSLDYQPGSGTVFSWANKVEVNVGLTAPSGSSPLTQEYLNQLNQAAKDVHQRYWQSGNVIHPIFHIEDIGNDDWSGYTNITYNNEPTAELQANANEEIDLIDGATLTEAGGYWTIKFPNFPDNNYWQIMATAYKNDHIQYSRNNGQTWTTWTSTSSSYNSGYDNYKEPLEIRDTPAEGIGFEVYVFSTTAHDSFSLWGAHESNGQFIAKLY